MHQVYISRDETGSVRAVNASLEGVAMTAYGHGEGQIADGTPFTAAEIIRALQQSASLVIDYPGGEKLIIERHGVAP